MLPVLLLSSLKEAVSIVNRNLHFRSSDSAGSALAARCRNGKRFGLTRVQHVPIILRQATGNWKVTRVTPGLSVAKTTAYMPDGRGGECVAMRWLMNFNGRKVISLNRER